MIFDNYPYLENDRLILRKPDLRDLPYLEAMLRQPEVYRYEPTYLPELMSENCREFILRDCDRLFQEQEGIILGIYARKEADHFTGISANTEPPHFLGIAELYGYASERDKISIGYRLMKENWHQGIAGSVVTLLTDYILHDQKMTHITAHVRVENPASVRCLLKNGYVQRREAHEEDWGFPEPVMANKYVIYPEGE